MKFFIDSTSSGAAILYSYQMLGTVTVKVAVRAAEQAGAAGLIHDKRAYAFNVAEKWLKARGVTLDIDLIYAAIEAAVYKEFNESKAEKPRTTAGSAGSAG